jgi:hypothetical protein
MIPRRNWHTSGRLLTAAATPPRRIAKPRTSPRFVVLDHQHAVALPLQISQRVDQTLVITLVESDERLVQNITDVYQARPVACR